MLILKILLHDLHRSRRAEAAPMAIVVPDSKGHSPVLVSSTRGEFIVRRKIVQGGHPCGVFSWDPDRLDELIDGVVRAAYNLSVSEKWPNIFRDADQAYQYIQRVSGTTALPASCLIPNDWSSEQVTAWAGESYSTEKNVETYRKKCRLHRCNTDIPVFFSRPDFVGLFTTFVGGYSSILLHNVKNAMAFCPHVP